MVSPVVRTSAPGRLDRNLITLSLDGWLLLKPNLGRTFGLLRRSSGPFWVWRSSRRRVRPHPPTGPDTKSTTTLDSTWRAQSFKRLIVQVWPLAWPYAGRHHARHLAPGTSPPSSSGHRANHRRQTRTNRQSSISPHWPSHRIAHRHRSSRSHHRQAQSYPHHHSHLSSHHRIASFVAHTHLHCITKSGPGPGAYRMRAYCARARRHPALACHHRRPSSPILAPITHRPPPAIRRPYLAHPPWPYWTVVVVVVVVRRARGRPGADPTTRGTARPPPLASGVSYTSSSLSTSSYIVHPSSSYHHHRRQMRNVLNHWIGNHSQDHWRARAQSHARTLPRP